jgi:epoxyqueuosine reductase
VLDSRRCISYLTIELRGPIPTQFSSAVGSHVYGCDVCQEVCPWNQVPARSDDPVWQPRGVWAGAKVSALAAMTDEALRDAMRGTAMTRTTLAGMRRNLAVAMANTGRQQG